jgi:WD40 repeat protein
MPNPTHPPTALGPTSETRQVPEQFRGPATPGGGIGSGMGSGPVPIPVPATQEPDKPGSGISRRKLLLGVGGAAGIAAVGGGVAFALGGKDSGTGSTGSRPPVGANAAATGTAATSPTSGATSSASATDSAPDSASDTASSDPATSASPSESAGTGPQPALPAAGPPVGHIEIPGQPAMSIVFVNGGKTLVVSDDKNGVQLFDVSNPAAPQPLTLNPISVPVSNGQIQPLNDLDYSAKRSMLALGGAGGLALWDVTDPTKPVQLYALGDVNGKKVNSVGFNSDGTKLVVATNNQDDFSDNPNGSCVLDITDAHNPAQWSTLTPTDRDSLNAVCFDRDDKYILSSGYGSDSSTALYQLWDAHNPHGVLPVDSTPWWGQGDSATKLGWALWLAYGGPWNTLVVGVVSADTKSQDLQFLDFANPLSPAKLSYVPNTSGAVAFHPTRPLVAIGDSRSGATTIYDMTDPKHPTTANRLVADAGFVSQIAFTPDGSLLAVAVKKDDYSSNAMVYFWKM